MLIFRYANKDVYIGNLRESQPHGHGELKKGRFSSQAACIYTGEWSNGVKHGYGVLDEIAKGHTFYLFVFVCLILIGPATFYSFILGTLSVDLLTNEYFPFQRF